jgi:hypothetical protein
LINSIPLGAIDAGLIGSGVLDRGRPDVGRQGKKNVHAALAGASVKMMIQQILSI